MDDSELKLPDFESFKTALQPNFQILKVKRQELVDDEMDFDKGSESSVRSSIEYVPKKHIIDYLQKLE